MRAWRVHSIGAPGDVLSLDDVEAPAPGRGRVRIDVAMAGINFPDDLMIRGLYQAKPPLPFTPGLEVVGVVSDVGEGVTAVGEGDRVIAGTALPTGGFAEQCLASEADCSVVPASVPDEAAASLLVTYRTSHIALHHRAHLQPGEWLLVHAGAGGVGSSAIQLGVAAGARVIATAGGPEKVELCRKLGAEVAIDYNAGDFVETVKEATDGRGADVIYDPVGGDVFDRSRKCIAWEGRILIIGFTSGRIADAPTNHVLLKNYSVVGVHMGAYALHDRTVISRAHEALVGLYEAGAIDPVVDRVVPLDGLVAALGDVANRRSVGKVLVRP